MSKKIPPCPSIPPNRKLGHETRLYRIRLVTPLFGGGVEPGESDEDFPIRGTSIRGQLQFWWRAIRGAAYSTRKELFDRHKEIWGTTDKASPVQIEVVWQGDLPIRIPCATYTWDQKKRKGQGGWRLDWDACFAGAALPYVLFPFQGKEPRGYQHHAEPEKFPAHFIKEGQFLLRVRFPEALRQDVETAIWAWVNFGGLGARTRRGCGSLFGQEIDGDGKVIGELSPLSGSSDDLKAWFQHGRGNANGSVREWPTLPQCFLYHSHSTNPISAWNQVVEVFREFRQGVPIARKQGRPAGQSLYPEPDTIRLITGRSSAGHQPDEEMTVGFPRAEFGLPIIFHFKDERTGDPTDTALYPFISQTSSDEGGTRDRMASPLILKPLALSDGQSIPFAIRLITSPLAHVELQNAKTGQCLTPKHTAPVRDRAFNNGDSPISNRSSEGSALDAFINYMKEAPNGFMEVKQ